MWFYEAEREAAAQTAANNSDDTDNEWDVTLTEIYRYLDDTIEADEDESPNNDRYLDDTIEIEDKSPYNDRYLDDTIEGDEDESPNNDRYLDHTIEIDEDESPNNDRYLDDTLFFFNFLFVCFFQFYSNVN